MTNAELYALPPDARPKFAALTEHGESVKALAPFVGKVHAVVVWDRYGNPRIGDASDLVDGTFFLADDEWRPVHEDGSPWVLPGVVPAQPEARMPGPNCQLSTEPLGKGDPRWDADALTTLFTDFLLNSVKQADVVSEGLVQRFAAQQIKNALVFAQKQHDYGPGNIAEFGEIGVLIRLSDKRARLVNLQGKVAANESVGDSWLDVANYGAIAQLVRSGQWPGCQEKHLLTPSANYTGGAEADRG